MIDLIFWPTPNSKKVTILLEELGLDYQIKPLKIATGEQLSPEFLNINPNARMPVIIDRAPADGGDTLTVIESGAIMMYLAEKAGQFFPQEARKRHEIIQWVMWQMANQGPKLGEVGHFLNYAPLGGDVGDLSYAQKRFSDEAHRIYGVLDYRLHNRQYISANEYTIADMICYPWTAAWEHHPVELSEFKNLSRWFNELSQREAVQKGMAVGNDMEINVDDYSPEEVEAIKKLVFNQRAVPLPA